MKTLEDDTNTKTSVESVSGCKRHLFIMLKKVKYEEDVQNAGLAQAQAKVRQQEMMDLARGEAQLKYAELFRTLLKDSAYGKLAASGQTGQSTRRRAVVDYASYGRDVSDISRKLVLNDRELARKSSAEYSSI